MPSSPEKNYARLNPENFKNIPQKLKSLPQWVAWRLHKIPGKDRMAKIPMSPHTGAEASVADPRSWGTFDEAVGSLVQYKLHGIGFVFTATDNYTGVDIDDCRNLVTGELGDWAAAIVNQLQSYTEISPSGTGVKIFIEAVSPGTATRRNKVEIYSHSRYFTVTGNRLNEQYTNVEKRQGELADLYRTVFGVETETKKQPADKPIADPILKRVQQISDDTLIERARMAANGKKFKQLFDDGDVSEFDGDHSRADLALASILAYWTRGDTPRIDKLFRRSKLMRKKWDERRGEKTYSEKTLSHAVAGTTALYNPDLDAALSARHNDVANAEIFVQLSENKFVWCPEWRSWLAWIETHWQRESDLIVRRFAEKVSEELIRRAQDAPPDSIKSEMKWAVQAGDLYRLSAIEQLARNRMFVEAKKFDVDLYSLCCANGVVDLRTGELNESSPDLWMTRTTGLRYLPDATCARFEKFLHEIMMGDEEMVNYLWRVIGYALTGSTSERSFFILHGGGRNGKTTFIETLKAVLGPYSQKARFQTFLRKSVGGGGANDDIAHLTGARLVAASEADQNVPLDVSLVKELTGSDTVRARHLYGREFEFVPQFKLFFATNHIPPIHESTHSIWDRLHYIPFNYRVPDTKLDRGLGVKLLGELEGILARGVVAAQEWFTDGLKPPAKVLKAREELYDSNDTLGQAILELCDTGSDDFQCLHGALYQEFGFWAKRQGMRSVPSSKALGAYLRERGYIEKHGTNHVKLWLGIRLRQNSGVEM